MTLMKNEAVIMIGAEKQLSLTNYRVVKYTKARGITNYSSIFLERISSVRFVSHDYKWFLYFGVIFCALGLFAALMANENKAASFLASLFVGGILIGVYFATRKQYFEICGEGAERMTAATGEGFENAYQFILSIEKEMKFGPEEKSDSMKSA